MKYIVAHSQTIWFEAEVEASSKEEALSKAKHPSFHAARWEQDLDSEPKIEWVVTEVGDN